jgi:hypothetical protein
MTTRIKNVKYVVMKCGDTIHYKNIFIIIIIKNIHEYIANFNNNYDYNNNHYGVMVLI